MALPAALVAMLYGDDSDGDEDTAVVAMFASAALPARPAMPNLRIDLEALRRDPTKSPPDVPLHGGRDRTAG